jgi:TolA-binding protein
VAASEVAVEEPTERTEKSVYDVAYRYMSTKQYVQAITEFKDLLWQYPEGTYAPNAYYWLGEIFLAQWQQNKTDNTLLAQAKEAFNTVVEKYTAHHKAVDALLKLGFIELEQEKLDHW